MAYQVHITRAEDWLDGAEQPIAETRWRTLVDDDPELRFDADSDNTFVTWRDDESWFQWQDGAISTAPRSAAALGKALSIAAQLDARVLGDDGERYTDASQFGVPPASAATEPGFDQDPAYLARERRWDWLGVALAASVIVAFAIYRLLSD